MNHTLFDQNVFDQNVFDQNVLDQNVLDQNVPDQNLHGRIYVDLRRTASAACQRMRIHTR